MPGGVIPSIRHALARAKLSNFDGFLKQIGETQDSFIRDIRNIYDTISLKNLTENLQITLAEATKLMGALMDVSSHQIGNRLSDLEGGYTRQSSDVHEGKSRTVTPLSHECFSGHFDRMINRYRRSGFVSLLCLLPFRHLLRVPRLSQRHVDGVTAVKEREGGAGPDAELGPGLAQPWVIGQ